jgi:arginyl-tRNA synthetase
MVAKALEKAVLEALTELGAPEAAFTVSVPEHGFGDYTTNAALVAAKTLGLKPQGVAEAIVKKLALPFVERVEIAGPGFLNFYLTAESVRNVLEEAFDKAWGQAELYKGKEVLIEYTSPNLFKPLHIGNLVGNILGESVSRLLESAGAQVRRINYPSDIGLTVAKGVWGLRATGGEPQDIQALGKAYQHGNTAYEEGGDAKKEIEAINKALYEGTDASLNALREEGIKTSRTHLANLLKKLGTEFDAEFYESQSGPLGRDIVRAHIDDGVFEESEGAVVYRGEKEGLHTRVFLNSQGLPTYEAKDVGLFDLKTRAYPGFDLSITVTGGEQADYFKVVFAALRRLFPERVKGKELIHLANGFLRLTTGKMSSRKGNIITGESLIADIKEMVLERMKDRNTEREGTADEVAMAGIKYSVLKQGSGRDIIFDPEKSLSLDGDSGPYLQYAHVRACALKRKAEAEGISPLLSWKAELSQIEKMLIHFPEVVERAAGAYEPHYVTTYLTALASAFNSWYAAERIVEDSVEGRHKLAVTEAFRRTMERGLFLLGIKAPEEM